MKTKLLLSIILICIIVILVASFFGIYMRFGRVNMDVVKEAYACFIHDDTEILHSLNGKEVKLLKTIFNGKKMYKDNLSCGFTEAISIKFDKKRTFCIAQDTCPIVYLREENRYIKLSEDEKEQLYSLLEPYGFFFPCI